jgi:cytochrome P450
VYENRAHQSDRLQPEFSVSKILRSPSTQRTGFITMNDMLGLERWARWMLPFTTFFDWTVGCCGCYHLTWLMLLASSLLGILLMALFLKRYRTYRILVDAKLPTVFWRPKFATLNLYCLNEDSAKKLSDSTITNILPRMKRLNGPYGIYGTVYGLSTPVIHVAHGVPALAILQATTTKTPAYGHFFNFCGRGVFTADGQDWKAKRTSVLHALIRHQDITPLAEAAAEQLVAQLRDRSAPEYDIVPILQQTTVKLIYRFITRTDLPVKEAIVDLPRYLEAITRIRMIILAQSRSIWFVLPQWCYRTFSSLYRSEEDTMQPIRALARQACRDATPESPLYALQQLPLYQLASNALDEAITLLFAGQDTSAATLSWTLLLLSQHPHVQQTLADELLLSSSSSLTQGGGGGDVKKQQHQYRMAYLDAVIKESMRLYPVAPFVVRTLDRDIDMPGVRLPAGATACIWIYSLHRNPDHWEEPDQFKPERWFEKTATTTPKQSYYMPFAAGPRNCVGQPLANVVVRLILARIVKEFKVMDPSGQNSNKRMQAGFTVLPQDGLKLKFVPRQIPSQ